MGLMDRLRGMFGGGRGEGGAAAAGESVDYKGYTITPAPERTGSGWNTAGTITKAFPEGSREHRFVRVDTHSSRDDALAFSVTKAQQIIDQQGDRLFESRR
jgi:hypothetical protein